MWRAYVRFAAKQGTHFALWTFHQKGVNCKRTEPGKGYEIQLEVWALPKEELGFFMENIPYPLAIGTVQLNDGTNLKGFVCEAAGVHGAKNISDLKTWRRYVA